MSTYSIGSLNQLGDALEANGWTAEDVTKLKQFKNLKGIKAIIDGQAEIYFPEKKWWKEKGIIYFKVISDGTVGDAWITRLEKKGFKLSDCAKELLLSKDFETTTGVVYTIAVLSGGLFTNSNRIAKKIRSEATKRKLATPNPEVACLIREMFSDDEIKAMGFSLIATFHKPIQDSGGTLKLLRTYRGGSGYWLSDNCDDWYCSNGFAFVFSQSELQS